MAVKEKQPLVLEDGTRCNRESPIRSFATVLMGSEVVALEVREMEAKKLVRLSFAFDGCEKDPLEPRVGKKTVRQLQ